MNCEPNDLCEIIGAGPDSFHLIGLHVVVTRLEFIFKDSTPAWGS